jgi:HSP20 family protein
MQRIYVCDLNHSKEREVQIASEWGLTQVEERKTGRALYREHCANEIFRVVALPVVVDASKAEAKLKNGVLEMHMPKGKPTKTARIQVKAN